MQEHELYPIFGRGTRRWIYSAGLRPRAIVVATDLDCFCLARLRNNWFITASLILLEFKSLFTGLSILVYQSF